MNREALLAEARNLISVEGELTPDQMVRAEELRNAIEATETATTETEVVEDAAADTEVEQIEETRAATKNVQINTKMNTPTNRFSLGKAVKEAVNGNITGFEAEVIQESMKEARSNGFTTEGSIVLDPEAVARMENRAAGDFQADSATAGEAGGAFVGVDVSTPVYTLRPKSIFDKLGVTRLTGLRGDLNLPVGAASVAANATEVGAANQSASSIVNKQLTPQRIAAQLTASKQLMAQSEANIEAFLMGDLMRAMGTAQDAYLVNELYTALTAVDGTGVGVADVITAMEGALDTAGADRDNAEMLIGDFTPFRTAAMVAGVNAVADSKSVLGYNTVISSAASDATDGAFAVMGDFSDFVIGEWGGLDLTVDPYSLAHTSQVRLIVHSHIDGTLRQTGNYKAYYNVGA